MEPKPPTIAPANALIPSKPMVVSTWVTGASNAPAAAAIIAPMAQVKDTSRFTGIPM